MKNVTTLGLAWLFAAFAWAQNMDYSGLEELFGEPVTLSATGKPQRLSEAPVSMEIITADQIQQSGVIDLPQLLRRYAGIDVSRNFIGHADVNVRGYNQYFAGRLLVLINGRQVNFDGFGFTLWNGMTIQLHEIKQIEVVRGPKTSLFGFNAASGVVNIVTLSPSDESDDELRLRSGSQSWREASLIKRFRVSDRTAARLSAGFLESDGYPREALGGVTDDRARDQGEINLDALCRISDRAALRFEAGYGKSAVDLSSPYAVLVNFIQKKTYAKLSYTLDSVRSGLWHVGAYHNHTDIDFDVKKFLDIDAEAPDYHSPVIAVHASNLISPAVNHLFRTSLEFRRSGSDANQATTGSGLDFSMEVLSLGVMWDWTVNERLTWNNSARLDHWRTIMENTPPLIDPVTPIAPDDYRREEQYISYNSSLIAALADGSSARFSISRGYHIPGLAELARYEFSGFLENYGNPTLDPESNWTVELGYTRAFAAGLVDKLQLSLYYQRLGDLITPVNNPPGPNNRLRDLTVTNAGDSESTGLEVSVDGSVRAGGLNWRLNYTWIDIRDQPNGQPLAFLDFATNQPEHKLNAALEAGGKSWRAAVTASYVSSVDFSTTTNDPFQPRRTMAVDEYALVNVHCDYRFNDRSILSFSAANLVDKHFERPAFVPSLFPTGGNRLDATLLLSFRRKF